MARSQDLPTGLFDLPDELLQTIVAQLPLESLIAVSSTAHRLRSISQQPIIWRQICRTRYRYWDPRHEIQRHLEAPLSKTDWKQLLVTRKAQDRFARRTLDAVISSQVKRVSRIQEIVEFGYDVKEFLVSEHRRASECEDVLARRFWIEEILNGIEKLVALQEWTRLKDGEDVSMERALGAFDLFLLQVVPESLEEMGLHLDCLAKTFRQENPAYDDLTTRHKALAVASFMRQRNIGGVRSDATYTDLENTLISVALCESDHPAIPLTSVVIYCCLARRLGLDAHPWGGTNHVMAIVRADSDKTLDGLELRDSREEREQMFLNPFSHGREVPNQTIRAALSARQIFGTHAQNLHMQPSSTSDMVQRMALNLRAWVRYSQAYKPVLSSTDPYIRELPHFLNDSRVQNNEMSTLVNRYRASYASSWVTLLFSLRAQNHPQEVHQALSSLFANFDEHTIKYDVPLIERHVIPQLTDAPEWRGLQRLVDTLKADDDRPLQAQRRNSDETRTVAYSVGQTFTHARYGYRAAIIGWDSVCKQDESWIQKMRVDSLPRGRKQCFYHVVVEDESIRYVAEENIELVSRSSRGQNPMEEIGPIEGLQHIAGRWFKRWDGSAARYISNVREQYPDD